MASLVELVQGLPPELFDIIKDLTFTATKRVVVIDKDYKPPTSLQVSKATREQYAESYYGYATTFEVTEVTELAPFFKYFSSITNGHRQLVSSVRLKIVRPTDNKEEAIYVKLVSNRVVNIGIPRYIQRKEGLVKTCIARYPGWRKSLSGEWAPLRMEAVEFAYSPADNADGGGEREWKIRTWLGLKHWFKMIMHENRKYLRARGLEQSVSYRIP